MLCNALFLFPLRLNVYILSELLVATEGDNCIEWLFGYNGIKFVYRKLLSLGPLE